MVTSLRFRIVVTLVGLVLLSSIVQGWFSYSAARKIIEEDAIHAVGISAEARRQALLYELRQRHERVGFLLRQLRGPCVNGNPALCGQMLQALVSSEEEVTGARLDSRQSGVISAGEWEEIGEAQLAAGQLAAFGRDRQGRPYYIISASSEEGVTLTLRFRINEIESIFLNRQGLGKSGESFLTDASALFLTPGRYAQGLSHSHPIEARPLKTCLSGQDTEVLDKDYRGVDIVHGFRYVPEIGGGCIMAHLDQSEAFAPAEELRKTLFLGFGAFGLVAIVLGSFVARALAAPIVALSQTAFRVSAGDLDARALVAGSDEVRHLAVTFNDMLGRIDQRTEELEAVNKQLEAFTYSISHDLRAPLRAIDGFSGILFRNYAGQQDAEFRRLLGIVRENAQKMGQLIDDLLAFSRVGRQEMRLADVNMKELVGAVFSELQITAPDRNLRCNIGELPPARGDRAMIRQVFVNLISNAIKFTRSRDPAVIEVGHSVRDDRDVYYVKDNGAGLDMEYAGRLFGVFQRFHSSEEFEGTGVGLAIVQQIIQRHGGRVWAEGRVGEGATIYFTLSA